MGKSDLVRFSRDGDQFHYLWAARRCLQMLSRGSGLVALSIEGASTSESNEGRATDVGEELIDIAEYYGSQNFETAESVRYYQLKHSTQRPNEPWTASGLDNTLEGFADRYKKLLELFGAVRCQQVLQFHFVSNRPISSEILETVADAAGSIKARHPNELSKLAKHTGLAGDALSGFCKLLRLGEQQAAYWDQRNILTQDVSGYVANADVDAPVQLKELINRKALSESSDNPTITKIDVLRALKTDESSLFPAPCLILVSDNVVPREQDATLIAEIVAAKSGPVLIHADGGVGKSVFSTRVRCGLPQGSVCILYDCFGNGQYRSSSAFRHRHKDALVQIANELSGMGLCHPLIPTPNADMTAYLKAFKHRISQSITSIRGNHPDALLCIVVDAADNAQMAAEEIGEPRSFVRDLLREDFPDGVRLVVTCRTHRRELLDPPMDALQRQLNPFSRSETATLLQQKFPAATEHDIDEFHRLSSQNPRVQATALSNVAPLHELLRALGPNPTTAEDTISNLLDDAISRLRDKVGRAEREQIDLICAGLATLRPLIPIKVLASISGVEEAAVRSFAIDLGRPLMVAGETIQFFDEPAETWFRGRFKPEAVKLGEFIQILRPLASKIAYVAAALPQLMLEAGQFSELVGLALSSDGLPEGSPLEKRDVELQRLQFALKASLRAKRYADAAKLALKAGGETAGEGRRDDLIQENTDLAALFMDVGLIQELVSRRTFGGGWLGSHHAYEAGLLSARPELRGDARSRLRMAHEWLRNWGRLGEDDRRKETLEDIDIAEMAIAHLNVHGASDAANHLRGWTPCDVSFRTGTILAKKLVDHKRYSDLDQLAFAADNDLGIVLAVTAELRSVHRHPPADVVERTLRLLGNSRVKLSPTGDFDREERLIGSVTPLVEAGCQLSLGSSKEFASLLRRYLPDSPPHGLSSRFGGQRFSLLRAYSLETALDGKILELNDLAHPELQKELEKHGSHHDSRDVREFKEIVGAVLPWHQLWVRVFLRQIPEDQLSAAIAATRASSSKAGSSSYREEPQTSDEIARLWFDILVLAGGAQEARLDEFDGWISSLKTPLFTSTNNNITRVAARHEPMQARSFAYARQSFDLIKGVREDASSKTASYVEVARAILAVSESEASAYFNHAVEVASNIGDENLDRWSSILYLADRAADPSGPAPEVSYKLARCAELTYDYVARDKYFDWEATIRAIATLCPSSCVTILSRWRDRKFGRAGRLLPQAFKFLVEDRRLDPLAPLALIGFRAEWDEVQLLGSALAACKSKSQKDAVSSYLYRYMRLDEHDASTWRKLNDIAISHGLTLPKIDDVMAFSKQKERPSQSNDHHVGERTTKGASTDGAERDWEAVFADIDLSSPNEISTAYQRFKSFDPPWYADRFFHEACNRVTVGQEDKFVRAIPEVPEFDLYELRKFFDQLSDDWKLRLSIKSALGDTLKVFCRRYCMEITKSRNYEVLPFSTACELSGLSERDIAGIVLEAIAETTEELASGRLFTLTGLLTLLINQEEALEVLKFGLNLFEDFLGAEDGDGIWSPDLSPPPDIHAAIAGYVWAGLAAPNSSLRWQAAHAVRGLCLLERTDILAELIKLAYVGEAGPFADRTLHFYGLHALQWLLIALARAARESPDSVRPHVAFLWTTALEGRTHILMQDFAAKAIQTLIDSGHVSADNEIRSRLSSINTSNFPVVFSNSHDRISTKKEAPEISRDWEYYFGIDMGPYWFSSLGRLFALSQAEISKEVAHVVEDEWSLGSREVWRRDQRWSKQIFADRETSHSHGSAPATDDLQFYLAYHGMMTVAGKLLRTNPLHQAPDDAEDELQYWLEGHRLSRKDGNWLADRRDPHPLEWPEWKNEKPGDNWPSSVQVADFERLLGAGRDRLNLWGRWTAKSGKREESVQICSAFVSRDKSDALMRALQTASNPHDYRIPDAVDDLQIDQGNFQLKGWVVDRTRENGLDEFDPWSGDIKCPPITPSSLVVEALPLTSDSESRTWKLKENNKDVIWCEIWGKRQTKGEENDVERGRRLVADVGYLKELLKRVDKDMIIEVDLRRNILRSNYESYKENDPGYFPPYTRIYLLKSDGSICTV
ncbi:AVAST type 3 anti-phage nuclease/ATPase Avs3a [Mesorhizobium sp. VK9D]|uniref:AVAST type 3 anti-phage nuclease/ATPase Avs3a n=1 Tax=Mesorhizobium australafricanum TaxID=3072311 RepID=UPI002A2399C9|nr:AVAST type 3 anti-phage nuclease/ATPase Avs3a [Mesorhizobium sp. VK9D]MDX8452968.1 AVAST type 3 anti-phage nuclease/ATPase Avs3a [Mesorhizobium sp. VK9D]